MKLGDLLPGIAPGVAAREVAGLTADSRSAAPGCAFFAVPGAKGDGLAYAARAAAAGAVAVVAERVPEGLPDGVAVAVVPDVRRALSAAAARFFPAQPGTVVAVTGTSGKTSVAAFVRQIWAAAGVRAASLGTLGIVAPDGAVYGSLTTPDPVALHRDLDRLARAGVTHLALEASSHGLDQHRLDGVRLAAGGLHQPVARPPRLPSDRRALSRRQAAPLHGPARPRAGPPWSTPTARPPRAWSPPPAPAASPSRPSAAPATRIRLLSAEPDGFATRLALRHEGRDRALRLPLAGLFQVSNALVAAGLCIATGTAPDTAFAALERLVGAPGRLERVGERRGAPIVVDYAHKPDALEKVLATLRPYAPGRLVVVFGCGGDRDPGKRPIMGEIASRLADVVIVTDDNPRSEEPAAIRAAILAAAPGALEVGDRAAAIAQAVAMLEPGDALVVAGKGHETGQTARGTTLPFSDAAAVAAALQRLPA